jgi:hypothetical protein
MNSRQYSGLVASILALSLMACTGNPLSISKDKDKDPAGSGATPAGSVPSPAIEFEPPDQPEEPVLDPIQGLSWSLREGESPRDQQIKQIHGALRTDGGYKFFLDQGERFYYRDIAKNTSPPAWSVQQALPPHRGKYPTRLFSDGNWLFFVNDSNDSVISADDREERVYQAKEGSIDWEQSKLGQSLLPRGIVAVAGGPGFAFAATEDALYRWDGSTQAWNGPIVDLRRDSNIGERFVDLSVDTESASKDLVVLMRTTDVSFPYKVKMLPEGATGYNALNAHDADLTSQAANPPAKVIRSYEDPNFRGVYYFWGLNATNHLLFGNGGATFTRYLKEDPYSGAYQDNFKGLTKLLGRFYAYRSLTSRGPEVFHRRDLNVNSKWEAVTAKKVDGSILSVTLDSKNSFATDGSRIYLAGNEGLYGYPLLLESLSPLTRKPAEYAQGTVGWQQESVELNRASVDQVVRIGAQTYVRTTFGTYTYQGGKWVPFELGGRRALLFSSLYGHAATVAYDGKVDFYLFLNGSWSQIQKSLPTSAKPKEDKVFFSKGRLFVASSLLSQEAVFYRPLDVTSDWTQAAPGQANFYPVYVSEGRNLLAVGSNRVKYSSLSEHLWKDYADLLVLPDGKTQTIKPYYVHPFAVNGYAFAWLNLGGTEYRLCRATSLGWKPVVNNQFEGAEVGLILSTDGHYLYSSTTLNGVTREIVRVPIKDGDAWERIENVQVSSVPLAQTGLKVNAPPFIDRDNAKVYLPTNRGILGP